MTEQTEQTDTGTCVIIGVTRMVVQATENPLNTRYYKVQHVTDSRTINLPEGEFIDSIWMTYNGLTMACIPMEPSLGTFICRPEDQWGDFARYVDKLKRQAREKRAAMRRGWFWRQRDAK